MLIADLEVPMEVRRRLRTTEVAIFLAVLAECAVFALLSPSFLTLNNFVNVTLQIAIYGILAVGMTVVMITGGIDLSVGSVVALVGVIAAITSKSSLMPPELMVPAAVLAGIGSGSLIGAGSGSLIARFGIPPFIVTLAMMTICRGVVFIITGGFTEGELPALFGWLGRGHAWFLPIPVVVMALLFAAGYLLLDQTAFGRHIYALGGNEEASRLSGIRVRRTKVLVYSLNGLLTGLAGVTLAARLGAGAPNAGLGYELDVIAAVVVGGTSLSGGRGSILGTLAGTIFIGVLNNGLNLANVDPYTQKVALGIVILAAVWFDRLQKT
jgi:ribose/xylose/arabinose/galactoside ABC-type transport system permease subunit